MRETIGLLMEKIRKGRDVTNKNKGNENVVTLNATLEQATAKEKNMLVNEIAKLEQTKVGYVAQLQELEENVL
ncbi:MAG TPA: hypothetical protein VJH89_00980 [Patescibacteria group bacterium]|nr:hypothetical protein [Patescibacteria group bacterium]